MAIRWYLAAALLATCLQPALGDSNPAPITRSPCAAPEYHAFDFWVGEWEVHTAAGQLAGTNTITSREADCALLEEWRGSAGGTGVSINYYDPARAKWVQHWISPGLQIHIEGGLDDKSMLLEGFIYNIPRGEQAKFRGTWTPLDDGRVRQFFEQADDSGQWSPWFEGFYSRAESGD